MVLLSLITNYETELLKQKEITICMYVYMYVCICTCVCVHLTLPILFSSPDLILHLYLARRLRHKMKTHVFQDAIMEAGSRATASGRKRRGETDGIIDM